MTHPDSAMTHPGQYFKKRMYHYRSWMYKYRYLVCQYRPPDVHQILAGKAVVEQKQFLNKIKAINSIRRYDCTLSEVMGFYRAIYENV